MRYALGKTGQARRHGFLKGLLALAALLAASPGVAVAQELHRSPLEMQPFRFPGFITANTPPRGTLLGFVGSHQTAFDGGPATGNQLYYGGVRYAFTDRLSLGLEYEKIEDPVIDPINGAFPRIGMTSLAASGQYRLYSDQRLSVSVAGSIEYFTFESPITGTSPGPNSRHVIGSLALPVSYALTPDLQVHVTPAVSAFPSSINGNAFYGTVPHIGVGASYQFNQRLAFYGSAQVPFGLGGGGNTITGTASISNQPVGTLGARFNVTPQVAIDLYLTNGLGSTPATNVLSFIPNGQRLLGGVRLSYTPRRGPGFRPNYRGMRELTAREQSLELDGFTLDSGNTLSPGRVVATGQYGSLGNHHAAVMFSPDMDGQIEVSFDSHSNDGSVPTSRLPGINDRFAIGVKLRFLDQNNGSPFSLSVRAAAGRQYDGRQGVLYLSVPMTYSVNPRLAVHVNPRAAAYARERRLGVGFGVNAALTDRLQLIGEITPVNNGDRPVWAVGARYALPGNGMSLDLHASNAIGRYGVGTLIGQSSPTVALSVRMVLDGRGFFDRVFVR